MKQPILLLIAVIAALVLSACQPTGAYSGTLILEGSHKYEASRTLEGALVVLGGETHLEPGSRLRGSVFLLDGSLSIEGEVDGDLSVIGGELALGPRALVGGDLRVGAGDLTLSPQAKVTGQVLTGAASGVQPDDLFPRRSVERKLQWAVPAALSLAVFASLAVRFAPHPLSRIERAALRHAVVSVSMGLLAGIVGLSLMVMIAFTLILVPITLLGLGMGFLAIGYGWAAIGGAIGRWLANWRRWNLSPMQATFGGAFVFALILNLIALVPYLGDVVNLAALAVSLGAVTLTRGGLREFVPQFE